MNLNEETDGNAVIVGDFNLPVSDWIDLPDRKSAALNDILNQTD